jgi:hypothetical protein
MPDKSQLSKEKSCRHSEGATWPAHRWVQEARQYFLAALSWARKSKRRLNLWFVICILNLLVVCETNVCLNSHCYVTLFMWDLIYVWLKLWWIYVRHYLCETLLIAMHVWKFLEHIIVDNQNCPFCEVVKIWNGLHHCVSLIEMVKNIYRTPNSEFRWSSKLFFDFVRK